LLNGIVEKWNGDNVRKGRNFDLFDDYSKEITFDRKTWMARDP